MAKTPDLRLSYQADNRTRSMEGPRMPPKPKDLREQPTRKRLMSPVKVESVTQENQDPLDSKQELQSLIRGEQKQALEKLKSLGDKYKPTAIKPSSNPPDRPKESAEDREETEEEETADSVEEPAEASPEGEPQESTQESVEKEQEESGESTGEEQPSQQREEGKSEEREEMENGEGEEEQPSPGQKPASPLSVLQAMHPDTSRMISRFLEEVQLHALEEADKLLKAGANLTLPQLIGTVKDLAELKVMMRWQAKLEKEIVKGRVPMVPPGAGRFPGLSKLTKISGQLKKAVGGETPEWAGDVPE
jgi:hypothetical protein